MKELAITENLVKIEVQNRLASKVEFAYLLGSVGKENFNLNSDVDLAVFWKVVPSLSEMAQVRSEFSDCFEREVDLISLNSIDVIFSRQVLETGRLLFCSAPGLHLKWKVEQMSKYPDFKFDRAIIEQNILKRKKYV